MAIIIIFFKIEG